MNVDLEEENFSGNYLSESQKRALTSSLYLFEKALRKAARLLSEKDVVGIFYSRKSRLSPIKRLFIQKKILQTLKELAHFANQLGVNSAEESIESEIMADMSICWENIEECRSKRLQKYGKLNPRAVQLIDPAINYFAHTAIELSDLVVNNSQDDTIEKDKG
jgi:hypothetical protein